VSIGQEVIEAATYFTKEDCCKDSFLQKLRQSRPVHDSSFWRTAKQWSKCSTDLLYYPNKQSKQESLLSVRV